MIKIICLYCLTCGFLFCQAQYPGYTLINNPGNFKQSFAQATSSTRTIQSDFSQEKSLTMLSEKINSTGKFWFQKEDRLRMQYFQPYDYLMILNAGKIYVKDGQKESKISAGSSNVFKQVNRILIDCVSGGMLKNPDFHSQLWENQGSVLVELKPLAKNLKELYKNINIVLDKKDYSATAIEMDEVSGNKTIIRFKNKEINAHIPDTVFNIP